MSEPAVLYEVDDAVATITLNRPENRNSMTPDVLEGLAEAVAQVRADDEVRCAILTGRGRSFCAGADFKSSAATAEDAGSAAPQDRFFGTYAPFLSVADIEVPTIAAMQGHAIGGGLGLAVVCDLRVANREARYGANFVLLGLHPGMAMTYLLPRLMGVPRAVEFLLTGRIVSGAEAERAGLVHYAVEGESVLTRARELAREIASAAPPLDQAVDLHCARLGSSHGCSPRGARAVAHGGDAGLPRGRLGAARTPGSRVQGQVAARLRLRSHSSPARTGASSKPSPQKPVLSSFHQATPRHCGSGPAAV
jgi:enoyl-CoA hydratase/carnithine racemase